MKVKVRVYRSTTGIQHRMQDTAVFQDAVYSNSEEMKLEFIPFSFHNNFGDRIKNYIDLIAYSEGVRYCNYNCNCKPSKYVRKCTFVSALCNDPYKLTNAMILTAYRLSAMLCEYNRIA